MAPSSWKSTRSATALVVLMTTSTSSPGSGDEAAIPARFTLSEPVSDSRPPSIIFSGTATFGNSARAAISRVTSRTTVSCWTTPPEVNTFVARNSNGTSPDRSSSTNILREKPVSEGRPPSHDATNQVSVGSPSRRAPSDKLNVVPEVLARTVSRKVVPSG